MKESTLTQLLRDIAREELQKTHMASKAWVREWVGEVINGHIDKEHRGPKPRERISTLEKQVKKLFSEIDNLKKEPGEPTQKLPRPGQLCYVWDNDYDDKQVVTFVRWLSDTFCDINGLRWEHWSFIPVKDIS